MKAECPPPVAELFGLPVARVTADDLINRIIEWSAEFPAQGPKLLGYVNAHTVNLAARDAEFRTLLLQMTLYADGMSIVRASRRLRAGDLPGRVSAADFFERFLWAAASKNRRVALIGADDATIHACAATLQARVVGLDFCYIHDGHFELGSAEESRVIEELAAAAPHVVLVGMGSPRQERWVCGHSSRIGAPVIWCVGALFEYFAGRHRAPAWMREAGLEWAYRLALEPKRLAGRYLLGNIEFFWRLWRERIRKRRDAAKL